MSAEETWLREYFAQREERHLANERLAAEYASKLGADAPPKYPKQDFETWLLAFQKAEGTPDRESTIRRARLVFGSNRFK